MGTFILLVCLIASICLIIDAIYSIYTNYKHNIVAKDLQNLINEGYEMNEKKNKLFLELNRRYNIDDKYR